MLIEDFDEMMIRVKKEFVNKGFKEEIIDDNKIQLIDCGKTVIVAKIGRAVQIFLDFAHEWEIDVFPRLSAVTVCGNSIFYYGRLQNDV